MRRLKRIGIVLSIIGLLAIIAAWSVFGGIWRRVEYFPERQSSGEHRAGFYLYTSPSAQSNAKLGKKAVILVQPNNSGINSDDAEVHRRDAWWTTFGRQGIADELGVVLLVPAFVRPAKDWKVYTHALDRDALTTKDEILKRHDLQLISMIEAARESLRKQGIETEERVLLQGFSASGMFANRFTALHPDRVFAVAAGAPGGWPIAPIATDGDLKLPYPAGIEDLESLTGKPFDLESYRKVSQLIYMGDQDDNDSLDFEDGWEKEAAAPLQKQFGETPIDRWKHAERLYAESGANAKFVVVKGEGHNRRKLQYLATDFFKKVLAER